MAVNFENLVVKGRAKAPGVCWSNEEWAAVCLLTKEFNIERTIAADFVRNGIRTVEDYLKAKAKAFVPQTLTEATVEVAKAMEAKGAEVVGKAVHKSKKKTK
jgi:hypothetical protein